MKIGMIEHWGKTRRTKQRYSNGFQHGFVWRPHRVGSTASAIITTVVS